MRASTSRSHLQKFAGASVALLLHGAVFFLLSNYVITEPIVSEPVLTLLVLPELAPPRAAPVELKILSDRTSTILLPQMPPAPSISLPPAMDLKPPAEAPRQPDLSGIGRVLFGCTLDDLASLTAVERARCSSAGLGAPPDEASLAAVAALAAEENVRFEFALMRKQQPLLLPCAGGIGISLATLYCLADGMINGFDLDSGKYPVYQPWSDENGPAGNHRAVATGME